MLKVKAIATSVALVMVTTATAVALNIGVVRTTAGPAEASVSATSGDGGDGVTTVYVDVPGEEPGDEAEVVEPEPADGTDAAPLPTDEVTPTGATTPAPAPARSATPAAVPVPTTEPPTTTEPPDDDEAAQPPPTEPSTTTTTAPATTTTSPPPVTQYLTYSAGVAGEVVIADHGDSLEFWSAYPQNGWQYRVENPSGKEIVVKYRKEGSGEGVFKAILENGRVDIKIEGFGGGDDD